MFQLVSGIQTSMRTRSPAVPCVSVTLTSQKLSLMVPFIMRIGMLFISAAWMETTLAPGITGAVSDAHALTGFMPASRPWPAACPAKAAINGVLAFIINYVCYFLFFLLRVGRQQQACADSPG